MNLSECYKILQLPVTATDEEIKKSFKLLAHKYHPDKNQNRVEWANNAMSGLNLAYTTLMQLRFRENKRDVPEQKPESNPLQKQKPRQTTKQTRTPRKSYYNPYDNTSRYVDHETLTREFVKIRESAKDWLYRYFQYGIYNISRRENEINKNFFNNIVTNLKNTYHVINELKTRTDDTDFHKHFNVFSTMIFNFYMASECVNITESYSDAIEVEAYSLFKKGDDTLHPCEKEIFYDRHNRGFFKKNLAESFMLKTELNFNNMLKLFPDSTWTIETKIKLQYTTSLKEYLYLFFSEYQAKN